MKIVVTGGSGKAGRWVVQDLRQRGHDVLNVDVRHDGSDFGLCALADLTDPGQAIELTSGADAIVHLAAIPAPQLRSPAETFRINALSTYNVFAAAERNQVKRVVWASSETLFGLPFTREMPAFAPITEEHPLLPENGYALAKGLAEEMARQMHRWNPDTSFMGLRISNIIDPLEYGMFADWQKDSNIRKWNLWSYVDSRDVAQACRLALEATHVGADHCIIAAADTVMARPSGDLMVECFPRVPVTRAVGEFESLQSTDKAHRLFGYVPRHSWRANC